VKILVPIYQTTWCHFLIFLALRISSILILMCRHSLTHIFQKVWHKSELSMHIVGYICISRYSSLNPNSNTLDAHGSLQECPAACFVAQQCSSTFYVSLLFNCHKEELGMHLKMLFLSFCFFIFKNCVNLKLCNSKLLYVAECLY
jgi:hypothetical protein